MFRRLESLFTKNYNLKDFLKRALQDKVSVRKYTNKAGFRVYKTDVTTGGKTEVLTLDPDGNVFSEIKRLCSDSTDHCLKRNITYIKKVGAKPKSVLMDLLGINLKNIHINGGDLDNTIAITAESKTLQDLAMTKKLKISSLDKGSIKKLISKEINVDRKHITAAPFFDANHKKVDNLYIVSAPSSGIKI